MKLLFVGGAGAVGPLFLPHLAAEHEITVFDLKEPAVGDVKAIQGDVRDFAALQGAVAGSEALLYFAMGSEGAWGDPAHARAHFDVNVTGLHLALRAAHEAGVAHAVVA